MRKILSLMLVALCCGMAFSKTKTYNVSSPNKKNVICVTQESDGTYRYSVMVNKKEVISPSSLGFKSKGGEVFPSQGWSVSRGEKAIVRKTWNPVWGKRTSVPEEYNELTLTLSSMGRALSTMRIILRAYNEGVAFRYAVPHSETKTVKIGSELTSFDFADDYTAWFYNGENHNIGPERLTEADSIRMPIMTVRVSDTQYMALHEADLVTGEPMLMRSKKGERRFTVVTKPSELEGGYTSAWRVILTGDTPGALVDSHLIELLNPESAPDTDFSWVKPGVALWDWRMNGAIADGFRYKMSYPSWVRAVDFAAEQGFPYLVLDANWYGPEHDSKSDPLKGDKANDVRKLIDYAKAKNVGIWLYLNDMGGKAFPIEETLRQYGEWGAVGVKYGFMQGTPEVKNTRTRRITELCAQNHLLVDFHDYPVHPYGQMRTWPNAVTREYCQAQLDGHKVFPPSTFVTSVFVNMVAGPLDMNNGMFDLRQGNTTRSDENKTVPSTLVSEAARTLIVFSGATIIPDIPEYYRKYPALLRFIAAQKMPWKESRTLAGEIGEYVVMMRQGQDAYLVGAATNETARTLSIPMSFLPKGSYTVEVTQDGKDAHYLTNRETLRTETRTVTRKDIIEVALAPGGGACLLIKKVGNDR